MSEKKYKKTYEGDYTKSYRDDLSRTTETAQQRQERQSGSTSSYNKTERSEVYDIIGRRPKESERVYAEGGSPSTATRRKQSLNTGNTPETKPKPPAPQPTGTTAETRIQNPPNRNEREDDGDYISYNPPIQQIGKSKFRNMKTNKEIGADEARNVLKLAGYAPKQSLGIGTLIVAFVVTNIIFPSVAAFAIIGYGAYRMFSPTTTWAKRGNNNYYRFILPASPKEAEGEKKIGKLCIAVGILFVIIRFRDLLF